MSKTFQDADLLTWEAYPTGGPDDSSHRAFVAFNCLSNRMLRPRFITWDGDEADAQRVIMEATPEQLQEMLQRSEEVQ